MELFINIDKVNSLVGFIMGSVKVEAGTQMNDVYHRETLHKLFTDLEECIKVVHPAKALIFGSVVCKGPEANDIDLLVVSDDFEGVLRQNRPKMLDLPGKFKFDLFLYTRREYKNIKKRALPIVRNMQFPAFNLECLND